MFLIIWLARKTSKVTSKFTKKSLETTTTNCAKLQECQRFFSWTFYTHFCCSFFLLKISSVCASNNILRLPTFCTRFKIKKCSHDSINKLEVIEIEIHQIFAQIHHLLPSQKNTTAKKQARNWGEKFCVSKKTKKKNIYLSLLLAYFFWYQILAANEHFVTEIAHLPGGLRHRHCHCTPLTDSWCSTLASKIVFYPERFADQLKNLHSSFFLLFTFWNSKNQNEFLTSILLSESLFNETNKFYLDSVE